MTEDGSGHRGRSGRSGHRVAADAELRKLARTLDADEAELAMLAGVPAAELAALRGQVGQALFDADKRFFVRMAALSRSVPGALAAKLAEAAVPPLMAARTAELLDAERGQDLIGRMSPAYLADVASLMDVGRCPQLIQAVEPRRVAAVGALLAGRGDWVVMGAFVSYISDEALALTVAGLDGTQLLRVAYVMDRLDRLDRLVGLLTDGQVDGLLTAAPEHAAWTELADLLVQLGDRPRDRLAQRYAHLPQDVRAAYEAAVQAGEVARGTFTLLAG